METRTPENCSKTGVVIKMENTKFIAFPAYR